MASAFAITTTTTSAKLPPSRTGQLQFTVTNTSGRQLTVRGVAVTPQGPEQKAWFTIDGQSERACPPNTALQYTVNVAVPASAPAGFVIVRFDAIGVENPDAYASQGPSVVLDVPAVTVPKAPFPWWIVAVAVLAVLLIGGGTGFAWWWVHNHTGSPVVNASHSPTPKVTPASAYAGTWVNVVTNSADPTPRKIVIQLSGSNITAQSTSSVCTVRQPQWCFMDTVPASGAYDPVNGTITLTWSTAVGQVVGVASLTSNNQMVLQLTLNGGFPTTINLNRQGCTPFCTIQRPPPTTGVIKPT